MNQIIRGYLKAHQKEYDLENIADNEAFEHFVNKCIINKFTTERFDPKIIVTPKGEIGLDGIAIILNNQLITDLSLATSIFKNNDKVKTKFVFIQAKTSENFKSAEIGTFIRGVKHFFEPQNIRPKTNDMIENLIQIKDFIYDQAIEQSDKPELYMYYVCCGVWNTGNNLTNQLNTEKRYFDDTRDFSSVNIFPYDSDNIINMYREMRRKISRTFYMDKKMSFYKIPGVKVAYFGLIKCKDIVNLLKDDRGEMFSNIFEDNVRDFQGYNAVNEEIKQTILDKEEQEQFSVLNNGITIIAKSIETEGDAIKLFDYQIVNGCQTSRVIFDNSEKLSDTSSVLARIIQVENDDILDKIVYTSNRQTEVKYEAFSSATAFHKRLQEYYNSIPLDPAEYKLHYERRSKQYDLDCNIDKNSVITLAGQTFAYIAMFFNEPHSVNRYYGEVLEAYKNKIYCDDDEPEAYYVSALYFYAIDRIAKKCIYSYKNLRKYKYHICCAMRALLCDAKVYSGNSKDLKKQASILLGEIKDRNKFLHDLNTVCTCINDILKESDDIPLSIRHRSKEFTQRIIKYVISFKKSREDVNYIGIGSIVTCVVTGISDYKVSVEIDTNDARKYGSVYISNIADKYIHDIRKEVKLNDKMQAKIINDYDEHKYAGWDLTFKIL